MTPGRIPDVMVDAAARAVHEHSRAGFPNDPPWDGLSEPDRGSYRAAERIALAAALGVCDAASMTGPGTYTVHCVDCGVRVEFGGIIARAHWATGHTDAGHSNLEFGWGLADD